MIIYDKFPSNQVDLIYLITCLFNLAFYTINKMIIEETKKIICKKNYEKNNPTINKNSNLIGDDDEDEDHNDNIKKNDSFYD